MSRDYDNDSGSEYDDDNPPVVQSDGRHRNVPHYEDEQTSFGCSLCTEEFPTKKELDRHKYYSDDHEYCRLHDLDFETWEDHGIHRVNSRGHKTCEHCYQDFKSRDGLELHIARLHRHEKSTICPYCGHKFKGGMAGLSMHIESNGCPGGMTRTEMNGRANALKSGCLPTPHDKWNSLDTFTNGEELTLDRETKRFQEMGLLEKTDGNDLGITQEDIKGYYSDIHHKFVCPCGKKFGHKLSMWQHLQSVAHQKKSFLCVGCQKHFKSSSALIQHQESGACKLAASEAAATADRATGGLVTAACRLND